MKSAAGKSREAVSSKRSGNPSGRPKKASDLKSELIRGALAPLIINENGKQKIIRKYQGFVKQLFSKALSGSIPAARPLVALLQPAFEKAAEEQQRALDLANRPVFDLSGRDKHTLACGHRVPFADKHVKKTGGIVASYRPARTILSTKDSSALSLTT